MSNSNTSKTGAPGGQASKMWSGRFREPLDLNFERWQRSFPFDVRLLPQEVAASKAHAEMIAAAGILTPGELVQVLNGLDRVCGSVSDEARKVVNFDVLRPGHAPTQLQVAAVTRQMGATVALNPDAEDIHHFVELQLTKLIGDLALQLHTGRSRNEQIATDMRLFVRGEIDATIFLLQEWSLALIELAERSGLAVMPSYTHLQRAEPVLMAHWLLAYVSMIERDASRLADARRRMNLCPLGSGAVAGATLALDRTIAARALGFDGPTPNSMDATIRPRLPAGVHAVPGDARPAHLPVRRGADPLLDCGVRLPRSAGGVLHRLLARCRRRRIRTLPSCSAASRRG